MQLRQTLTQTQQLKMNPQLYQSIKLMELPSLDLREKIEEELERNPALEILEDKITVSLDKYSKKSGEQASDNYRSFIEGTLTRAETLQEHLLWQLHLEPINEELRKIAEMLIQNLNNDGFHIEDPETLYKGFAKTKPAKLQLTKALQVVRKLEPAGCCTKDYKESLKAQIELVPHYLPDEIPAAVIDLLLDNLDLIEKEKYSVLAKKTGLDEDDIHDICEFIKTLSPFPGRAFTSADTRYVIPDIKVTRETSEDGQEELIINLNDEAFPILGVNKFYEKLIDSENKDNSHLEARDFARENIKEAQLFIDHLKRRNKTLIRAANAILQFQYSFFIKGPKYLAPLTLKDIAKELEVHETTVSRIANGKYMQTEWGIFEIRYFFTNSISGSGSEGSKFSKESVKEIIKEIISASTAVLPDQEISAILAQKGIALARRTVAKYRKELDMGSSYTRKAPKTKNI
ncbi:MAG: RNA polymerase factor sigma-54 [Treponema sp.]|jgi:RNA polymerase sigma-54 factor|nr:RNA polymerase factor sigma-54 [Treponema sp.]